MSDNPYAPPESEAAPGDLEVDGGGRYHAEQVGNDLAIDKTATFPKVCLKCGSKEVTNFQDHLFQYNPPYVFFLVFICNMLGLLAMLLMRKTAKMVIPLCSECDARWRSGKMMALVGIGVLLLGIMGPYFVARELLIVGFVVGVGAFLAIIFLKVNPSMLRARKIDDSRVTIIGIHPDAVRVILKRSR
ncbi:MAG: hypothetical protein AB7K71_07730 [Polyangiaceae bacterium]